MSPESYSWETIEAAEELYIIDGLTFEQVAERTGVSVSQLKRWSSESTPTWPERRKEYRQAQTSVRYDVMLAKAGLIKSVIETQDPMKAFAFGAIVKSAMAIDKEAREQSLPEPVQSEPDVLVSDDDLLDKFVVLQRFVGKKIATMLSHPGAISLKEIDDLQKALGKLEEMKAAANPKDKKGKGASAETIDMMRTAIMKRLSS